MAAAAVATIAVVVLSDAECTQNAIADGAVDPAAQALLSGALKQVYAGKGSVGGVTVNATVDALKQVVGKQNRALGRAIDAAEYRHCMVK